MNKKHRIISDTHFWHQLLIDIWDRKKWFESKIKNSLSQLWENDILYHLWDICIWNDMQHHNEYIKPLKCKKVLVLWNHDRKSSNWYLTNWRDVVVDSMTISMFWKEIKLIHIPTEDTATRALEKDNRVVIHWHYHTHWRPERAKKVKHILYSCEYENMQPRTIDYLLSNPK